MRCPLDSHHDGNAGRLAHFTPTMAAMLDAWFIGLQAWQKCLILDVRLPGSLDSQHGANIRRLAHLTPNMAAMLNAQVT